MSTLYHETLCKFKQKVGLNQIWKFYKMKVVIARESEKEIWKIILLSILPTGNELNSPEGASNPRYTDRYEALIHHTTNYINKLEGFRNKELDREFAKNIQDYANFVKLKYDKYIQGNKFVKTACRRKIMSNYSANFDMLLNGIMNLYPCLYKMNETTRYPLRDFGYANLSYLNKKTHVTTFS
jgi:hypothetical protein